MIARARLAFALLLALALAAAPARAHIESDHEVVVLRELPPQRIRALLADAIPDDAGLVGANRGAWRTIEAQTPAGLLLADAAARADSATAERAWKALDAAFVAQQPSGDFVRAGGALPPDAARRAALGWAGESCRAVVAVVNSPLQERFRWRYSLMLPKLRRSLDWLVAGADALFAGAPNDAPQLLAQARTFLLADGMFHEEVFGRAGQRAVQAALALQQSDGTFRAATPGPASQAACIYELQSVTQYFSTPSLEGALSRAVNALAKQVRADGTLLGAAAHDRETARAVAIALSLNAAYSRDSLRAVLATKAAAKAAAPVAAKPPVRRAARRR